MNKMRGQRGLNYGGLLVHRALRAGRGSRLPVPNIPRRQQFFSIWIRPVPHHYAHFALRQAVRELRVLVEDGLTAARLRGHPRVPDQLLEALRADDSRRLGYHMDSAAYGTGYFIDEIQRRLPELTVDDVNAAIPAPPAGGRPRRRRRHPRREAFGDRLLAGRTVAPDLQRGGDRGDPRRGRADRVVRARHRPEFGCGWSRWRRCSARSLRRRTARRRGPRRSIPGSVQQKGMRPRIRPQPLTLPTSPAGAASRLRRGGAAPRPANGSRLLQCHDARSCPDHDRPARNPPPRWRSSTP